MKRRRLRRTLQARGMRAGKRDSQRCLDRRGRQSELEGGKLTRRDEREHRDECRSTNLQRAAEAFLPRANRRDDAPQPPGEVHDQPAGELDRLGPRDGRGLDGPIGAQRRRHRHHRQNLSRRPHLHEIRKLGPRHVDAAAKARQARAMDYTSGNRR